MVSKTHKLLKSGPYIRKNHIMWLFAEASIHRCSYKNRVLKICSKFTGEHPMSKCNFTLRHGCSPVNLLHIFRIPFLKNTFRWLLLFLPFKNFKKKKKNPAQSLTRSQINMSQTNKRPYSNASIQSGFDYVFSIWFS